MLNSQDSKLGIAVALFVVNIENLSSIPRFCVFDKLF